MFSNLFTQPIQKPTFTVLCGSVIALSMLWAASYTHATTTNFWENTQNNLLTTSYNTNDFFLWIRISQEQSDDNDTKTSFKVINNGWFLKSPQTRKKMYNDTEQFLANVFADGTTLEKTQSSTSTIWSAWWSVVSKKVATRETIIPTLTEVCQSSSIRTVTDSTDHPYENAIRAMRENCIAQWHANGKFYPDNHVRYSDFLVMYINALRTQEQLQRKWHFPKNAQLSSSSRLNTYMQVAEWLAIHQLFFGDDEIAVGELMTLDDMQLFVARYHTTHVSAAQLLESNDNYLTRGQLSHLLAGMFWLYNTDNQPTQSAELSPEKKEQPGLLVALANLL